MGGRTVAVVGMIAMALAAMSLSSESGASAQDRHVEDITVVVGGYQVFASVAGVADGEASTVTSRLTSPSGVVKARAHATSDSDDSVDVRYVRRGAGPPAPVLIEPLDRILVDVDGVRAASISVPELTSSADPQADVVSGTAPGQSRIAVIATSPGGGLASGSAQADADGEWSVDLSGELDLVPGSRGVAVMQTPGSGRFQSEWLVRDIQVRIGANELTVPARSGQTVTASVTNESRGTHGRAEAVAWGDRAELWLRDADGDRGPVGQGDMLRVQFTSGETVALQVPPLAAYVDAERDLVTGTAPIGDEVTVMVDGQAHRASADVAAEWSVDLTGEHDVTDETVVVVSTSSAPWCSLTARAPRLLSVDPFLAAIELQGTAGELAGMELLREVPEPSPDDGLPSAPASRLGSPYPPGTSRIDGNPPPFLTERQIGKDGTLRLFVPYEAGEEVTLVWGDRMAVQLHDLDFEFESPPIEAAVDTADATVNGRTTAGSSVKVAVGIATGEAAAGPDGYWEADLTPAVDLRAGDEVRLTIDGPGGYRTQFSFPVLRAAASPGSSVVRLEGAPGLEAEVEVWVDGRERPAGTGRCKVWRRQCNAGILDASMDPVPLGVGDRVVVRPTIGVTTELEMATLTAHIDISGKSVTGEGPPGGQVHIGFSREDGEPTPIDTSARVFGSGVYDYELKGVEQELLLPGLIAEVTHELESGHQLYALGVVEIARANHGPVAWGLAEPRTPLRAELRDPGGALVADVEAASRHDASFWLDFRLWDGSDFMPEPLVRTGDTVTVTHERGTHVLQILPLAGARVDAGGALLGITAPNARLRARHTVLTASEDLDLAVVDGWSDEAGLFYLEAPPFDRSHASGYPWIDVFTSAGDTFTEYLGPHNELSTLYVPAAQVVR